MNIRKCFVSLVLAFCFMAVVIEASTAAPIKARISIIQGKVEIRLKGSDAWKPASPGLTLEEGTTIRCGKDSTAVVTIKGDAIKIGALSQLTLDSMKLNPDGSTEKKLNLQSGDVHAKVAKMDKKSSFSIKTPTSVCGVRGTSFHMSMHDIAVNEGAVYVIANEKEIDVPEGGLVQIYDDGTFSPQETIPEPMLQKMNQDDKQCSEAVSEEIKETSSQGNSEQNKKDKNENSTSKQEKTTEKTEEKTTEKTTDKTTDKTEEKTVGQATPSASQPAAVGEASTTTSPTGENSTAAATTEPPSTALNTNEQPSTTEATTENLSAAASEPDVASALEQIDNVTTQIEVNQIVQDANSAFAPGMCGIDATSTF